jgi:hypothetical protein
MFQRFCGVFLADYDVLNCTVLDNVQEAEHIPPILCRKCNHTFPHVPHVEKLIREHSKRCIAADLGKSAQIQPSIEYNKNLLIQFYQTFDPSKINLVDIIIDKLSWSEICSRLLQKYGSSPGGDHGTLCKSTSSPTSLYSTKKCAEQSREVYIDARPCLYHQSIATGSGLPFASIHRKAGCSSLVPGSSLPVADIFRKTECPSLATDSGLLFASIDRKAEYPTATLGSGKVSTPSQNCFGDPDLGDFKDVMLQGLEVWVCRQSGVRDNKKHVLYMDKSFKTLVIAQGGKNNTGQSLRFPMHWAINVAGHPSRSTSFIITASHGLGQKVVELQGPTRQSRDFIVKRLGRLIVALQHSVQTAPLAALP